ncbi:MAG: hypothetical protein MZV70_44280 [Desulfobacterales bacterium]|nr:hypothetical protein [Desulfobacterales bacterium]
MATLNLNNVRTSFTLTATYQVPASTRTGNVPERRHTPFSTCRVEAEGPIQEAPFVPSPETKHAVTPEGTPFVAVPGSAFAWKYGTAKGPPRAMRTCISPWNLRVAIMMLGDQLPGDLVPVFRRNPSVALAGSVEVLPEIPLPTGLPPGEYNFYAVLVRAGNMPLDLNNWVSDLAFSTMRFSLLSPQQEAVIRDYGYPSQFVKTFIISDGEVRTDEVWAYGGRGVNVSFINGAFIEEGPLAIAGIPAQAGSNRPENYQFDTTAQQIRERHGQPSESASPPFASDLFSTIGANRFFSYNGIVFGFNNEQLVFVMSTK